MKKGCDILIYFIANRLLNHENNAVSMHNSFISISYHSIKHCLS